MNIGYISVVLPHGSSYSILSILNTGAVTVSEFTTLLSCVIYRNAVL